MAINEVDVHRRFSKERYCYRFSWLKLMRPMTFTGTISPILAGTALAAKNGKVDYILFVIYLLTAILVQSTVNILNDYFDFKRGQDLEKWVNYEEKVVKNGPRYEIIPYAVGIMILVEAGLGLWLAFHSNPWVLAVGTLGILFGYAYSGGPIPLSSIGLGELTAAIFLGFVPTTLAYLIQGHTIDTALLQTFVPFSLLIASMILTNNIRDLEKDKSFRITFAMMLGRVWAYRVLMGFVILAYLWVAGLMMFQVVNWTAIACFFALPLGYKLIHSVRPGAARAEEINAMKLSALHHWIFGLLFAASLWIAWF